jgi:branched-subunit amino acid transport protein AzlD
MTLTPIQTFVIICMVTLGTVITRFLPFILFPDDKENHPYITYLGKVLPFSLIGLLVVYCPKCVNLMNQPYGLPETVAIICIVVLHYWKSNPLLSIGVGTGIYMLMVQLFLNKSSPMTWFSNDNVPFAGSVPFLKEITQGGNLLDFPYTEPSQIGRA